MQMHVAMVCTGSFCDSAKQPEACRNFLQQYFGFKAEYSHDTFEKLSPSKRAEFLLAYCLRDDIDLVWAVRGGEGSADLLPFVEEKKSLLRWAKPKTLIGFSDFTPLLIYFYQEFGWPAIHGPGCIQFIKNRLNESTILATRKLLVNNQLVKIENLLPLNSYARQEKVIRASLVGGCLSLLTISIKDVWEVNTANRIIIIEDVNEKPHVISRSLKYLRRINFFNQAQAVILGCFTAEPVASQQGGVMQRVLQQFADNVDFPVLQTDKFGHGKNNLPLPFARPVCLTLGESGCLE